MQVGEAFNAQDAFKLHSSASGPVDASGRVNVFGHVMAEVLSTNAQMNDEMEASAETSPAGAKAVADAENQEWAEQRNRWAATQRRRRSRSR